MITANIAREMAFEKVNTTYKECFDEFMGAVSESIEKSAKKGHLDVHLTFDTLIDKYFKKIKSDNLNATLKEIIKEKFSKMGFEVVFVKHSYRPDTTLIISW